jgi:fido (protein-threonine AMPylation protein)
VVARIIQDHYDALEGLFDFVGGRRQLSTGYIKELQAALLRNQDVYAVVDQFGKVFERPFEKGLYKTLPNNPTRPDGTVHEYCPPEHVASEMDRLVAMHAEHETGGVPVEVEAAWLHHRFTQIHPFADGNGRVARAIASLVLIKAGWFPLIVKRDDRVRYIEALEKADAEELKPLVSMATESQRNALMEAAEVAWDIALRLMRVAEERFGQIAQQLKHASGVSARVFRIEESMGRDKNFNVRLVLAERPDELELSFRPIGPRYRGRIEVSPCLCRGTAPALIEGGTFLINYAESYDHAQARFSPWLERIIVAGLNQWRLTL